MNFNDYDNNHFCLYQILSTEIEKTLREAIESRNSSYKLQCIKSRAKNPKSLEKKLKDRGLESSEDIENHIKDLAGCRMIFYYENDMQRFIDDGIIEANFTVHHNLNKNHYNLTDEIGLANEGYSSFHYIVELKEDSPKLKSYPDLKGFKCEIQIHTTFSELYAEATHDITYKNNLIPEFGNTQQKLIDERLKKVVKDYLRPAGYELTKVLRDAQVLKEGKAIVSRNLIQEIRTASNNNNIYDILEKFLSYVLPLYDDPREKLPEIEKIITEAFKASRAKNDVPIETPWGPLSGKTSLNVFQICLKFVELVKYGDLKRSFLLLTNFFESSYSLEEKDAVIKSVGNLANFNINEHVSIGFFVQRTVINEIKEWDDEKLQKLRPLVLKVCQEILSPSMEQTTWSYHSAEIEIKSILNIPEISEVRAEVLTTLENLFNLENSDQEKVNIFKCMLQATKFSHIGNETDSGKEIVTQNTKRVLCFFAKKIPSLSLSLMRKIEHDVYWIFRSTLNQEIKTKALELSDTLKQDKPYLIFRDLIGWDDFNLLDWNDDKKYEKEQSQYRDESAKKYAQSINDQNFSQWLEYIKKFVKYDLQDSVSYQYFNVFLKYLGQANPIIALKFLEEHEAFHGLFISSMLGGLWLSSQKNAGREKMIQWIKEGRYLDSIVMSFSLNQEWDKEILKDIFQKATEQSEINTLEFLITTSIENYNDQLKADILEIFISSLRELTKLKNSNWINSIYYNVKLDEVIQQLPEDKIDIILENLLGRNSIIDSPGQKILTLIAKKNLMRVINFLGERLKQKKDSQKDKKYDALPCYNIDKRLKGALSGNSREVINSIKKWYQEGYDSSVLFLKALFDDAGSFKKIEDQLIEVVKSTQEEDLKFILNLLKKYDGETFLHNTCKEIIKVLPTDSPLCSQVISILENTGTTSGEFGVVESLQQKEKIIKNTWLNDEDQKINQFAQKFINLLKRQIANKKKRCEERLESRKREYE